MPETLTVVQLSEAERGLLKEAINNKKVESVLKAHRRILRGESDNEPDGAAQTSANAVRVLAGSANVSIERLAAAKETLAQRKDALAALPNTNEGDQLLHELDQALSVVDESLRMLRAQ